MLQYSCLLYLWRYMYVCTQNAFLWFLLKEVNKNGVFQHSVNALLLWARYNLPVVMKMPINAKNWSVFNGWYRFTIPEARHSVSYGVRDLGLGIGLAAPFGTADRNLTVRLGLRFITSCLCSRLMCRCLYNIYVITVKPGAPTLSTNVSSGFPRESDQIRLTCESTGGNPVPNVTWYRNGVPLSAGVTLKPASVKFGTMSGLLDVQLSREDNGANFTCLVENDAGEAAASIQLSVHCTLKHY